MTKIAEYTPEIQSLFLTIMLTVPELYTRVANIFNVENFSKSVRPAAEFIKDYVEKYSFVPTIEVVNKMTSVNLDHLDLDNDTISDFFLEEFESFTKRQELERAILKSADLLEKGEFEPVEKLIKDAVQISLVKNMGTDYFSDPIERLNKYFNQGGQVSTGWPQLDRVMYGGMSRGELNIFAGGSGSGKSLVMMNLALNWLSQGLSGVYITLELSEELTSLRTDAMLTGTSTKQIRKNMEDTALKVKLQGKKMGQYRVKDLPAQSNVNAIRAYIKELQIQTGIKIDFVMIDYLDLVMPVSVKVNPNDQFIKDKYVSEELRNLAKELGVLMVTASQLNRSAVEEIEFDHSHIAGGISKINTADYVFGIFTSRSMRERGKYQIQCMKSRSSTGVGQKIDLEYDIETMRITDEDPEESSESQVTPSRLMDQIKKRETINPETGEITEDAPKIKADVRSSNLNKMLQQLKKDRGMG
jgi:KaiC/GvpD/RAD55 family RecA-like ATPase